MKNSLKALAAAMAIICVPACGGGGGSGGGGSGVNLAPVHTAPVTSSTTLAIGQSVSFTVVATDPESQPITYSAVSIPPGSTFVGQMFSWTPVAGQAGGYLATFRASDGVNNADRSISINVLAAPNNPPTFTAPTTVIYNITVGQNLNFGVAATDPEGQPLTYSGINIPPGATFSSQVFNWTPVAGQAGTYSVTFRVADGFNSVDLTVSITVTGGGGSTKMVPSQYSTIQAAINAAVSGDTVLIAGTGSWFEDLTLKNGVTIEGTPTGLRTQLHGTMTAANGVTCEVKDLKVYNALSLVTSNISGNVTFTRCTFIRASIEVMNSGSVMVQNCTFNGSVDYQSAYIQFAIRVTSGSATILRSIFVWWVTALNTTLPGVAGSHSECVFWNNTTNMNGIWTGSVYSSADPLHTAPEAEYYLDTGSPAIISGSVWAGSFGPANFTARPQVVSVTPHNGVIASGMNIVLEVDVTATGTPGAQVTLGGPGINKISTYTNFDVPNWETWEAGGSAPLQTSPVPLISGKAGPGFFPNYPVITVGQTKKFLVKADLTLMMTSGSSFEVWLLSFSWSNNGIGNGNGTDQNIPVGGISGGIRTF